MYMVDVRENWVWALPILRGQARGSVGRVSVFWLRWCRGLGAVGWCYVCVRCESGFSV